MHVKTFDISKNIITFDISKNRDIYTETSFFSFSTTCALIETGY